ncbi:MAG: hypothetical protein AB7S99_23480, partial [Pseudodonghicola sp.]
MTHVTASRVGFARRFQVPQGLACSLLHFLLNVNPRPKAEAADEDRTPMSSSIVPPVVREGRPVSPTSPDATQVADRVTWIGALDPMLRNFDVILKTANGTSYNAYAVRGSTGVAITDTVKQEFTEVF